MVPAQDALQNASTSTVHDAAIVTPVGCTFKYRWMRKQEQQPCCDVLTFQCGEPM